MADLRTASPGAGSTGEPSALDRARAKAFRRLLPLLFICYVVAYIDRVNVGFVKLNMQGDLKAYGFDDAVFGFGMGIFFLGYLLLEIPGTLIVEHWSARKWISRIMISWGFVAALNAFVHYRVPGLTNAIEAVVGEPHAIATQFYLVRFLLGLAEAGFYPGVIVYLTHWFPQRDRTKALAWFFIGTPIAQILAPPLSEPLMKIGENGNPAILGLVGWQWVFIIWGLPAVLLGFVVLATLTDKPGQAHWLADDERQALETELAREKALAGPAAHMGVMQALTNPKVLLLAAAYFFVVTGNYGVELFMASIFKDWYSLDVKQVAYMIVIPPLGSLVGQLFVGWNSDRTGERRWHATLPIVAGALALIVAPFTKGQMWLSVALFTVAMTGLKAYLPAFWSLPSLLMSSSAAAASIGLINSFGNLGGWIGPWVVGYVKDRTGSYQYGLWFLAVSMCVSALIIASLGIGRRSPAGGQPKTTPDLLAEPA